MTTVLHLQHQHKMSTIVSITLPKLGESVADATIISWLKKPGDFVKKDELIAEVATDKVDTDLPSEFEGVLEAILVKEGDKANVGSAIATIKVEGDVVQNIPNPLPVFGSTETATTTQAVANNAGRTLNQNATSFLTPVVRNIAAEAGLTTEDLSKIATSGNHNRITKKDILSYLTPPVAQVTPVVIANPKQNLEVTENDEVIELTRMRKLIGAHMVKASQLVPHVTSFTTADVSDLVSWRDSNKEAFTKKNGVKLTYTHIIMQKVIQLLKEYPKLNAWMNGDDEFIIKNDINLGFAAATPDENLIVPNVKAAQKLDVVGLAKSVNALGKAAKSNSLKPTDIERTTFTVSNTGIFGSMMGTPIISVPQVAILALGEIASAPSVIVENGEEKLAIRKKMYLSLSYDHRVIDGAYASKFLKGLKHALETV
jgi:2-oxoglutarate dehydrogenase E2 component (dihydrolipoamide succinyltransferase)